MTNFFSGKKKLFAFLILIAIALAIPLTVFVSQQQQTIRQRAGGNDVRLYFTEQGQTAELKNLKIATRETKLSLWLDPQGQSITGFDITISSSNLLDVSFGEDVSRFDMELANSFYNQNGKLTYHFSEFYTGNTPINQKFRLFDLFPRNQWNTESIAITGAKITSITSSKEKPYLSVDLPTLTVSSVEPTPTTTAIPTLPGIYAALPIKLQGQLSPLYTYHLIDELWIKRSDRWYYWNRTSSNENTITFMGNDFERIKWREEVKIKVSKPASISVAKTTYNSNSDGWINIPSWPELPLPSPEDTINQLKPIMEFISIVSIFKNGSWQQWDKQSVISQDDVVTIFLSKPIAITIGGKTYNPDYAGRTIIVDSWSYPAEITYTVIPTTPSESLRTAKTCSDLKTRLPSNFAVCEAHNRSGVCFEKFSGLFMGCFQNDSECLTSINQDGIFCSTSTIAVPAVTKSPTPTAPPTPTPAPKTSAPVINACTLSDIYILNNKRNNGGTSITLSEINAAINAYKKGKPCPAEGK